MKSGVNTLLGSVECRSERLLTVGGDLNWGEVLPRCCDEMLRAFLRFLETLFFAGELRLELSWMPKELRLRLMAR